MGNAPHLVSPLPFLIPLFGKDGAVNKVIARAYSTALWMYDLAGGFRIGKRHKRLRRQDVLTHFPALDTERLAALLPSTITWFSISSMPAEVLATPE